MKRLRLGWRPADWEGPTEQIWNQIHARAEEIIPRAMQHLGEAAAADRDDAESTILHCAREYARNVELSSAAPSSAAVLDELERWGAWSREGGSLLAALAPLFETLGALDAAQRERWLDSVREMAEAAESLSAGVYERWPDPAQPLWIAPKRELVVAALDLFERYRPGVASSNETGDFAAFVSLIHQLATGEAAAPLDRSIREVVPGWRRRREEISAWEQSYDGLYCALLNVKSRIAELEALEGDPAALEAERQREVAILDALSAQRRPGAIEAAEREAPRLRERHRT
jgi:hypothetical protein